MQSLLLDQVSINEKQFTKSMDHKLCVIQWPNTLLLCIVMYAYTSQLFIFQIMTPCRAITHRQSISSEYVCESENVCCVSMRSVNIIFLSPRGDLFNFFFFFIVVVVVVAAQAFVCSNFGDDCMHLMVCVMIVKVCNAYLYLCVCVCMSVLNETFSLCQRQIQLIRYYQIICWWWCIVAPLEC